MSFSVVDEVAVPGGARVYEEGWQSWSPTGWYDARTAAPPRPELAWQHTMRFRPGTALPAAGLQGEGLLAVDTGRAVRAYVAPTVAEVPTIRARLDGDRLVVTSDGPVRTVEAGDAGTSLAGTALAGAADDLARAAGIVAVRRAPTVWCSWYRYFLDVTEADILENLAALSAAELPVDVVQIDDGWQAGIGDWTTISDRFTSLARLAGAIRSTGRRAGIWVAPFIVGSDSGLAREHPDWLVGDAGENWGQALSGLDLTHPGARDYLHDVFTALRGAGFDYFKLDFLYAGAVPGPRRAGTGPVAAYRSGLELVREAVGPEAFIVGCGAPIVPSVGLVDAMRVSPDTFHPEGQDGSRGLRGAPGVVARAWQHGRWWVNDPDCFVGRPSYALREEWAAVVDRYGGLRSCSDRIAELDDWGLTTTRHLLATAPPPVPFDA